MRDWSWINDIPKSWAFLLRVIAKALILFGLCNLIFAIVYPMDWLGQFSLYGVIYPARTRLPYYDGKNPAEANSITLDNLPALFASHTVSQDYPQDEFRVFLIGDSNTWGWLLEPDATLSAHINAAEVSVNGNNGNNVVAYNLAYPVMSLTKDLLILDEAMQYKPDMIIWLTSLASFPPEEQLVPPLVRNNPARLLPLIDLYNLSINPNDENLSHESFITRTIVGQRRPLADLLRLQSYGVSWAATGIDQAIPATYSLRQSDFEEDFSWSIYSEPSNLSTDDLAFDVLSAGVQLAGDVPVIIVNEPIFISEGQNSHIRYNSFYPHWAYTQYREMLTNEADVNEWQYIDLWDGIAAQEFTDSPVHLTKNGTATLAALLIDTIIQN